MNTDQTPAANDGQTPVAYTPEEMTHFINLRNFYYGSLCELISNYGQTVGLDIDRLVYSSSSTAAMRVLETQKIAAAVTDVFMNEHVAASPPSDEPDRLILTIAFWGGFITITKPASFGIGELAWTVSVPMNPLRSFERSAPFFQALSAIINDAYRDTSIPRDEWMGNEDVLASLFASLCDTSEGTVCRFSRRQFEFRRESGSRQMFGVNKA